MRARKRPHPGNADALADARKVPSASPMAGPLTARSHRTAIAAAMALALLAGCGAQGPEAPPLLSADEIAALNIPAEAPATPRAPSLATAMDQLRAAADPGEDEMSARAASLRARAEALRQQDAAQRDAASDLRARAEALRRQSAQPEPVDCAEDPDCGLVREDG